MLLQRDDIEKTVLVLRPSSVAEKSSALDVRQNTVTYRKQQTALPARDLIRNKL
jgi:hypothetical protein|tara:strand:+ start:315 stop:476 length:162 start_codon:yes stop_codon:yes gene_type:complete